MTIFTNNYYLSQRQREGGLTKFSFPSSCYFSFLLFFFKFLSQKGITTFIYSTQLRHAVMKTISYCTLKYHIVKKQHTTKQLFNITRGAEVLNVTTLKQIENRKLLQNSSKFQKKKKKIIIIIAEASKCYIYSFKMILKSVPVSVLFFTQYYQKNKTNKPKLKRMQVSGSCIIFCLNDFLPCSKCATQRRGEDELMCTIRTQKKITSDRIKIMGSPRNLHTFCFNNWLIFIYFIVFFFSFLFFRQFGYKVSHSSVCKKIPKKSLSNKITAVELKIKKIN